MRFYILSILLCLTALFLPSYVAAQSFPPPSLINITPSLAPFLERLEQAADERDQEFILSLVHDDCVVSYGGFRGLEDFKDYWFGPASHGRDFFMEMEQALRFGGVELQENKEFVIPYTSLAPGMDQDGIMLAVVLSSAVNVRAGPGINSRRIGMLGHELVRMCNIVVPVLVDGMDWSCVLLANNKRGYVAKKFLALPTAQCFRFRLENETWMLVSTVTGE